MKKFTKLTALIIAIASIVMLSACALSNEPCEYCGDTPTKGYKTSNDEKFYVCNECSSECAFCGDKATKHYTNLIGMEMFVCRDCYESIAE